MEEGNLQLPDTSVAVHPWRLRYTCADNTGNHYETIGNATLNITHLTPALHAIQYVLLMVAWPQAQPATDKTNECALGNAAETDGGNGLTSLLVVVVGACAVFVSFICIRELLLAAGASARGRGFCCIRELLLCS